MTQCNVILCVHSTHAHTHKHTQSQNSPILLVEGEERERGSVVEDKATPAEEEEVLANSVAVGKEREEKSEIKGKVPLKR